MKSEVMHNNAQKNNTNMVFNRIIISYNNIHLYMREIDDDLNIF